MLSQQPVTVRFWYDGIPREWHQLTPSFIDYIVSYASKKELDIVPEIFSREYLSF